MSLSEAQDASYNRVFQLEVARALAAQLVLAVDRFTEDGNPINRAPYRSWKDRLEQDVQEPRQRKGMPRIEAAERDAIFKMLKSMLTFRSENRSSAKQILECEWMQPLGDRVA
ncbi:kinase-like domain-containing protein [Penicillium digitatum]|uniref:Kinase-like domain-containing protein n=1 Tax=Penicillium digitatum TaxID=36651 RepID=A0A7T6XN97_PENDI|nr:kinase-like domain-containing protein [Penicillium digitatum]